MCNQCSRKPATFLDAADAMHEAVASIGGLSDLIEETVQSGKNGFDVLSPAGLSQVVRLVDERMRHAHRLLAEAMGGKPGA